MEFEQLDDGAHVFSIGPTHVRFPNDTNPGKVHITSELVQFAQTRLVQALGTAEWGYGVSGQLLKVDGSRWIRGAIRFRVIMEFKSTEPEPSPPPASELDEFRQ